MLTLHRPNVNVFFPSQADNEASGGNVVRKKKKNKQLFSSHPPSLGHLKSFWGWCCAIASVATVVIAVVDNSLHF